MEFVHSFLGGNIHFTGSFVLTLFPDLLMDSKESTMHTRHHTVHCNDRKWTDPHHALFLRQERPGVPHCGAHGQERGRIPWGEVPAYDTLEPAWHDTLRHDTLEPARHDTLAGYPGVRPHGI